MSDRLDGGVTQMSGQGGGAAPAGGRGGGPRVLRWLAVLAVAVAAVIAAVLVFSAVHLLPQLRNPFAEFDHRPQRAGPAPVDHLAEPVRGRQRVVPGGGGPVPEDEVPAPLHRGHRHAVRRPGHRHRLRRLLAPGRQGPPGVAGPDRGDGPAARAPARARHAQRPPVLCLRAAAGAPEPDRQLLLQQPEQPAAGLHPGPAEDPGRSQPQPAAGPGADEHPQHAHRHAARAGVQAGHGDFRRFGD